MDDDLREALETLHDFRAFWQDQVTQTRGGGSHHNPMWQRVANVLDKHGMNECVAPENLGVCNKLQSPSGRKTNT